MRQLAITAAPLAAAALLLAACSTDGVSVASPTSIFRAPSWANFQGAPTKVPEDARPVTAADLVTTDGACGSAEAGVTPGGGEETRGVGLEMTECQVVRRIGKPDRVEIGADPGGRRTTVVTYLAGMRPGIYHFVDGRLKQVERAPEPVHPAKPQKKPKRTKSNTASVEKVE